MDERVGGYMSFDVQARYELMCRASQLVSAQDGNELLITEQLTALHKLIQQDLSALARSGSPDNFADILRNFGLELERFREFCEFPDLAQKVVVGFGGAFSAGKSSLINALLGKKRLVTEVSPTTSLPTYLLHGVKEEITALNLFQRRLNLSQDEFLSLTHDEKESYGSQIGALLRSAFMTTPDFAWRNLALLDTPGYSKPESKDWNARTDEQIARAQLNSAQFIVWVVSIDGGTISEDDLNFLVSLRADIPRLVVLTHADKKTPSDVVEVVNAVRQTLGDRALAVLDVIAVTKHTKKRDFPIEPVLVWLSKWNTVPRALTFAKNFKREFTSYARFIEAEQRVAYLRLNRLNRILALTDSSDVRTDAEELQHVAQAELQRLEILAGELHGLRQVFFKRLKVIGDAVGIPLPEPEEIDLLDIQGVDLLALLQKERETRGKKEEDYSRYWRSLLALETPSHVAKILRRTVDVSKLQRMLP